MADSEVIRAMVMRFRLSELQTLLTYAGKCKSGRKSELQHRALDLIKLNSNDIKMKIRELSNEMGGRLAPSLQSNTVTHSSNPQGSKSKNKSSSRTAFESSSEEEFGTSTRRKARSTRSCVSYVEPEEDEASEMLSEASDNTPTVQESDDDGYDPLTSEEAAESESEGEEEEEEEEEEEDENDDEESSSTDSAAPAVPSKPYKSKKLSSTPNILKRSSRKSAVSNTSATSSSSKNTVPGLILSKEVIPVQDLETKHDNGHLMYPPCPDVQLIPLPFYKVEAVLLKPSSLNPCNAARFQAQTFVFHLTPSQASAIVGSGCRDASGKLEYKNQIQLRFCLNETSCPQDDNFPASICVIVNGRSQPLPNIIPTNKPGIEPKRPPKPINITGNCKLSATLPNYLNVTWTVEAGKGFCVAIYYVEKLTSNTLIKTLKDKGNRHPAYTKAIIKDKLNDRYCEIATTSCKVTLACPLGKMRMSLPCRATTCDHLQCFDARLYIQMNERKPKWICPVCNKSAIFENLMVDGYFYDVLNDPKLGFSQNEIVLKNDATWEPLPPKTDEGSSSSLSKSTSTAPVAQGATTSKPPANASFETVDVVDDDDEVLESSSTIKTTGEKIVECITLDDSDEEDGQPAKKLRFDNHTSSDSFIPLSSGSSSNDSNSLPCNKKSQSNKEPPALICLSEDDD